MNRSALSTVLIVILLLISFNSAFLFGDTSNNGKVNAMNGDQGNNPLGADEPVSFTNVSEQIGLGSFSGSFLQWGDYDNDGDLDLLINGNRLMRNNGIPTGTWNFTDVSSTAGISDGGVWGDYDRDGWLDTFGKKLWHNNGDGTFTEVTGTALPGLRYTGYISAAGWGDYDKDGYLDLYVARGEDYNDGHPIYYPDDLWHNNGNGTFTDVTVPSGISDVEGTEPGAPDENPPSYGRGVSWIDYNDDNWIDIYISNYRMQENFLFENNGNGTFTNTAPLTGCLHDGPPDSTDNNNVDPNDIPGHTIGSVWGDFENDGDFDVWVNNFNHKDHCPPFWTRIGDDALLCRNNGPPDYTFTNFAGTAGIHRKPYGCPGGSEGDDLLAGNAFGDYDNDGDLDLWLTQVYGDIDYAYSYLYKHDGVASQHFTQVANDNYGDPLCVRVWNTYAGIFVDYDNDGDLDLITAGKYPYENDASYMIRVFQNSGNSNSWLEVKLMGDDCDKFGVGARIYVNQTSSPNLTLMDWIRTSEGAHNHANGLRAHFGLGAYSGTVTVEVRWPCGNFTALTDVAVNQTITIQELEALPAPPTNIDAGLEGTGLEDVNITWTLSIDDGSGKDNVNNYAIYRNTSYDGNGTDYDFLDEIPNGTNHYIDIGAGDGDPSNYFYYIQTNGTSGEVTKNDTQVGKFVREMKYSVDAPRELISIPLEQSDTDISTVLQTIQGSYNHVQWYDPLDMKDRWKTNATFKPPRFDDLLNVDHKMALWITMTSSDNLTIAGKVPEQTSIQLYEGWNFVSYASFINRTVENALSGIPYEKVEGFDENNPPYYLKTLIASDWMEAGNGYWIYAKENCTWTIEN